MPMQMDPSIGQDQDDDLIQQVRSRGGARSTFSRPIYITPQRTISQPTTPRDPQDVSGIYPRKFLYEKGGDPYAPFVPATSMPEGDAKARGLTDQSGLSDPLSIYYDRSNGQQSQAGGRDMAGAYQALLHSVALQHGGKAPADGSTPQASSNGQTPKIDPKQAFQQLLHSVAIQHGGQPPSEAGGAPSERSAGPSATIPSGGPASSNDDWRRTGNLSGPETSGPKFEARSKAYWDTMQAKDARDQLRSQPEDTGELKLPPKLPPKGASKEDYTRYHEEHAAWEDDRKFAVAHAMIQGKDVSQDTMQDRLDLQREALGIRRDQGEARQDTSEDRLDLAREGLKSRQDTSEDRLQLQRNIAEARQNTSEDRLDLARKRELRRSQQGQSVAQSRLKMAAMKAQYDVAQTDLTNAKAKLERGSGWFTDTSELEKEVTAAQKRFDSVKSQRDKLVDGILDNGSGVSKGTKEDPIMLKSGDEATADMIGKIVSVNGKLHRVEADE